MQLVAGALRCSFEDGAIRDVRWKGVEVLRGIAYLLRDSNWGTAPATVEQLEVEQGPDHFRLQFVLRMVLPEGALLARAVVEGRADGVFSFRMDAVGELALSTNRCGFVVLHPASAAGVPLQIEHTNGAVEPTVFPQHISPGQVAFNIRRLRHTPLPGLEVDCQLQAELPHDPMGKFEMEDQRNWSDASFKTYVASLLDPWPYVLQANTAYRQEVLVAVHDSRVAPADNAAAGPQADSLVFGEATGQRLPATGLGVPRRLADMQPDERACVLALKPAWLVAEVDASDEAALPAQIEALQALAQSCGARVQLDVICSATHTPATEARRVASACKQAGLVPDAVRALPAPYLKSFQPSDVWPDIASLEDYAQAMAERFPQARVGGGMLTYFTELNRKRPSATYLAFIGHTTCPLVHAADDVSVMQTLESLPSTAASVRALWPDLGYRLGPVTLGLQRNPYGASVAPNPKLVRMAMAQNDPRHPTSFGAAWIAGYAAAVADQQLELLSFNHSHGISGPLLPQTDAGWQPQTCIPAWRVQAVLSGAAGCALHRVTGLPQGIAAIAWRDAHGAPQMLLANLGAQEVALPLSGDWTAVDLSSPCKISALSERHSALKTPSTLGAYQVLWLGQ